MSLTIFKPSKESTNEKIKNNFLKSLNFVLRADIIILIFLISSIVLEACGRKVNVGWYIVFGIFLILYFVERNIKFFSKRKNKDE